MTNEPSTGDTTRPKMPVGLAIICVFLLLTGLAAALSAAFYPAYVLFYIVYSVTCIMTIVGSLQRSKAAWYMLVIVLVGLLMLSLNTLVSSLTNDISAAAITKSVVYAGPLVVALGYTFSAKVRRYFEYIEPSN